MDEINFLATNCHSPFSVSPFFLLILLCIYFLPRQSPVSPLLICYASSESGRLRFYFVDGGGFLSGGGSPSLLVNSLNNSKRMLLAPADLCMFGLSSVPLRAFYQ